MNTPDNMTAYLDEALRWKNPCRAVRCKCGLLLSVLDRKLAGYLKLNEASAQTDLHDEQSLNEDLYLRNFRGGLMFQGVT